MRILLVCILLLGASLAQAGDEVNYSAPYLVVEDGKLVTKYPAQEHEAASEAADASATPPDVPASSQASAAQPWIVTGAVLATLVGGLAITVRRRP